MQWGGHSNQAPQDQYQGGPPPAYGGGGGYGQGGYDQGGGYGQGGYDQGGYNQGGYASNAGYSSNEGAYGGPPGMGAMPNMNRPASPNIFTFVFFAASLCVMFASFFSFWSLLFSGEIMDGLECIFLFLFGAILAIVDTPFCTMMKGVLDFQMYIGKYVQLLVRLTGKGLSFLFLGTTLFSNMWANLESGLMLTVAMICGLVIIVIGIAAVGVGFHKSRKLDRARRMLMEPGVLDREIGKYAQSGRGDMGLTPPEFNSMTMNTSSTKFEDQELKIIFSALGSNPSWRAKALLQPHQQYEERLSFQDLQRWVNGGLVML